MLNLNIGILGHVDSGKTSLAKVLSKVASTASFDKNPQSQERGITLDLGFSSFMISIPDHLKEQLDDAEADIQFTLVDCPGHASLIRTIIGGSQIIDMMLLVIDATKGMQTQTAECLIIGELTCKKMIVVVNKIDLIPNDKRKHSIDKMTKKLSATLSNTKFKNSPIVFIAANAENNKTENIPELIKIISEYAFIPERNHEQPFLFAVDHCFGIKGQGTVMTGTVLQGSAQVNDSVQIPSVNLIKKIKSMQMFRKPIQNAKQGDRIGICLTQFDPELFERGIICTPDFASITNVAIIKVQKINYFKFPVKTKSKFHISIGHETIMAHITCFSINKNLISDDNKFSFNLEYNYLDELCDDKEDMIQYLILEFEKPVLTVPNCLVIGSKLDLDVNTSNCRLAFWGTLMEISKDKNYKSVFLPNVKIFKNKKKEGIVERLVNDNEIIVKNMFQKDTNIQQFLNLQVILTTGELGKIESQFGQSGKIKVYIPNGLKTETTSQLQNTIKKKSKDETTSKGIIINVEPIKVNLHFKRYIYDSQKKIIQ